jgi:hypothetical protein
MNISGGPRRRAALINHPSQASIEEYVYQDLRRVGRVPDRQRQITSCHYSRQQFSRVRPSLFYAKLKHHVENAIGHAQAPLWSRRPHPGVHRIYDYNAALGRSDRPQPAGFLSSLPVSGRRQQRGPWSHDGKMGPVGSQ